MSSQQDNGYAIQEWLVDNTLIRSARLFWSDEPFTFIDYARPEKLLILQRNGYFHFLHTVTRKLRAFTVADERYRTNVAARLLRIKGRFPYYLLELNVAPGETRLWHLTLANKPGELDVFTPFPIPCTWDHEVLQGPRGPFLMDMRSGKIVLLNTL